MQYFTRLFSSICFKRFLGSVNTESKKYLARNEFRAFAVTTEMASDNNWRGVPLTEIWGSQTPWGAPEFPLVAPAFNHTVLYHIPSNGSVAGDRPPKPQSGHDKWDHDYVRMPCSSRSLYPVEDESGETHLMKRWDLIESALRKPIRNSKDLAAAILSYNTQFKESWKFWALHKLFNDHLEEEESQCFFDVTLPEIANLALALPRLVQAPIPLLKQHKNRSISLSQQQIASILANAFFCTFPRRNSTKKTSEYASFPHINFITLYNTKGSDAVLEKLTCLCHYFKRVCSKAVPVGVLTFSRRSVPPRRLPAWPQSARPLGAVPLHVEPRATIEDSGQLVQMDFANKYLGGGVLGYGCVQEEIRFVICPELMVSMLFTEVLRPNEALMMIGCERYSNYTGYGSSFRWAGEHRDPAPHDSSLRRRAGVLALDAQPYGARTQEYHPPAVLRDLNKAWVGFSFYTDDPQSLQYPGIATGNWGCGAFGGSPALKSLVQLMACAEAWRPMAYYTFQDTRIRDEIISIYNLLSRHNVTVGQLYKLIMRFCQTDVRKMHLHAFIEQCLKDGGEPPAPAPAPPDAGPELMDISDTADDFVIGIPESLEKELLKPLKESPDLFAQDEADSEETQVINTSEPETPEKDTKSKEQASASKIPEDKMAATKIAGNKMATSLTSDLFAEMSKFDQTNGLLNFSKSHTNILKIDEPVTPKAEADMDTSIEATISVEPTSEVKRKMAKKITDYFSKKPY